MLELKAAFFALQNSSSLHQQIRENPFTSSDISSLRDVEFCSRQKTNLVSKREKSHCREKVKGISGQPGLDAASSSVSGFAKRSSLLQCRSLCNTCEPSGSGICQLETRAWGSCHRCFQCKMGFSTGLSIPSLLHDRKMPKKDSTESVTSCSDHTSVEKQTLVSSHSVSLGRATMASSKTTGSSETSRHQKDTPHLSSKNFRLAAWPISGRLSEKKDFHRKSQISFSPLRQRKLPVSMKVPERHGIASVLSRTLSRFQPI